MNDGMVNCVMIE